MKVAIYFLLAISGAEVVTNLISPFWGTVIHVVILVSLIVYSSLAVDSPNHRLFLALALSPLTRILSMSMPLVLFPVAQLSALYWYIIIYPILLLASWVTVRRANFQPKEIGLTVRRPYSRELLIALSGVVLGITEYVILRPEPIVPELAWNWVLFSIVVLVGGTGFTEEFIFRGIAQRASIEVLGRWGVPYVAVIFAVLHLIHHSPIDILFVLVVGLYFGWVVNKTGSLLGVTLAHGLTNFLLYVLIPSLV